MKGSFAVATVHICDVPEKNFEEMKKAKNEEIAAGDEQLGRSKIGSATEIR